MANIFRLKIAPSEADSEDDMQERAQLGQLLREVADSLLADDGSCYGDEFTDLQGNATGYWDLAPFETAETEVLKRYLFEQDDPEIIKHYSNLAAKLSERID